MPGENRESRSATDDAAAHPSAGARVESVGPAVSWWRRDPVWIWIFAALFTVVAWWPLVLYPRGGLQGGDIYTYFFPLKTWYAERLRAGELPLWNPLIGHGVPALAESQTGVFYPFNLIFYRWLPLGAAYNANFLLHYTLAFGFTCHYARRLGLPRFASLLSGVVFVYGWFPARSCLEWAIVTGAWIPLALLGVEGFLAERRRSWLLLSECAVLMQLLAGHFNLAFITLVLLALYAPLRLLSERRAASETARPLLEISAALGLTCGLAAVQIVPSWELKGRSQRGSVEFGEQKIGYGCIPASYLAQAIEPWRFYPHVRDRDREFDRKYFGQNNTNKVEAHLYFGLVPMALAAAGLVAALSARLRPASGPRGSTVWTWTIIGAFGLALVTGWWTPWAVYLAGFGYFTGPGRYGVLVQLAVAMVAGHGVGAIREWTHDVLPSGRWRVWLAVLACCGAVMLVSELWMSWAGGFAGYMATLPIVRADQFLVSAFGIVALALFAACAVVALRLGSTGWPLAFVIVASTWVDLALAGQFVQYAEIRRDSPVHSRAQSVAGALLREEQPAARVLARNQNAVSLCGVATVPPYLGIGPREYFDGPLELPADFHWANRFSASMLRWMEWAGVTHVLSFDEMDDESLELVWMGHDPFLHELLGRPPWEPLWLYRFVQGRGRAYWVPAGEASRALDAHNLASIRAVPIGDVRVSANRVEFVVESDADAVAILTDLNYPGWHVQVDGRPAEADSSSIFRAVRVGPGRHQIRWDFRPLSFLLGAFISLVSLAGAAAFGWTELVKATRRK